MSLIKINSPWVNSLRNPNPLGGSEPDLGSSAKTYIFTLKPSSSVSSYVCTCVRGRFLWRPRSGTPKAAIDANYGKHSNTTTYQNQYPLEQARVVGVQIYIPYTHVPGHVVEVLGIQIGFWLEG